MFCSLINEESNQDGGPGTCKEVEPEELEAKKISKVGKCRSRSKIEASSDCVVDADGDQANQGVPASREEKISNLKMVSLLTHSVVVSVLGCSSESGYCAPRDQNSLSIVLN